MDLPKLNRANSLKETIAQLTQAIVVLEKQMIQHKGLLLRNGVDDEVFLNTDTFEIRACVTGMLTGLKVHLSANEKTFADL